MQFEIFPTMQDQKKVLIVEDDMFIRDIYQVKFSNEGFMVFIAENGQEALDILEKEIPDIILLDVLMPVMGGMETLKKIRENELWGKIPIIMLTNISEQDNMNNATDQGADGYLVKAYFTPVEILEKVRALIAKNDQNS